MKKLFVVAGEVSGDTHGAGLIRSLLQPSDSDEANEMSAFEISGLGGPVMAGLSADVEDWLEAAAVLGFWEVLIKYGYFRSKMEDTLARIEKIKPDAVVLIDYPGFNLRLAARLHEFGYGGKLIFYISPQVWAWKKGRISRMAELLDLMICIFPFEKDLYENSGLKTVFAGHPLVDKLEAEQDNEPRDDKLVALLPGSREREIEALFPAMIEAACRLLEQQNDLKFATAAPSKKLAVRMRQIADERGLEQLEIDEGGAHRVMQGAVAGVVASGTATLEAAVFGLPYCLVYRVAWPTYLAGKMLIQVDFLGIVNILAGRQVVVELLQKDASAERIFDELDGLVNDGKKRAALVGDLAEVVGRLGEGEAYQQAAQAVREEVLSSEPKRSGTGTKYR